MTHELQREITERTSRTDWSSKSISMDTWRLLFEAARHAPSSWNHQPARYIVVTEQDAVKTVCDALHRCNAWATRAAGLVIQVARPDGDDRVDGKDYYLYDCGLAMMSMVYQAQAMGITCRQMLGFDEPELKRRFCIPETFRIVVVAGFGYPADNVISKGMAAAKRQLTGQNKRYAVEHLVSWQTFGGREE